MLENDKNILENEKLKLETNINNLNESIKIEIENKANQKINEIKNKFEEDKLKLKRENDLLKEKLDKNNNLSEEQVINQELKIRLSSTINELSKITGLMANNRVMDEDTLKLVDRLKTELRVLNEQTELYSSQRKF